MVTVLEVVSIFILGVSATILPVSLLEESTLTEESVFMDTDESIFVESAEPPFLLPLQALMEMITAAARQNGLNAFFITNVFNVFLIYSTNLSDLCFTHSKQRIGQKNAYY